MSDFRNIETPSKALVWTVEERSQVLYVKLVGDIDENADLKSLEEELEGVVSIDLGDVRRINSAGVREWVNFIRKPPRVESAFLVHCSPTIVNQLNMIYNFKGMAAVKTFFAPYVCTKCDEEVDVLLNVDTHFEQKDIKQIPEFTCSDCGELLIFDDIPERYFAFILHQ